MTSLTEFSAPAIDGTDVDFTTYADQVVLVVNTASKCGFTPQYQGLQALHDEYAERGFTVLGFPCDQFGHQEPGTEEEIASFCEVNYGVTFPMFGKVEVNGDGAHPLFAWLTSDPNGAPIDWNFNKFLVGRDGGLIRRYDTGTEPAALADEIEKALAD
jgi:glutathione peroxidase